MTLSILGIDISKLKFDLCLLRDNGKLKHKVFPNNAAGASSTLDLVTEAESRMCSRLPRRLPALMVKLWRLTLLMRVMWSVSSTRRSSKLMPRVIFPGTQDRQSRRQFDRPVLCRKTPSRMATSSA